MIFIAWRHKSYLYDKYEDLGSKVTPKVKIHLNKNQDYSVPEIKDILLKNYVNLKNETYFESSITRVGYLKGNFL